ncbi:MAG: haloacid dehalogenase type II [Burkholderiaceae bacterium]|nr:haloacid dehalogenase type II [Burkholderiaceae bacterium]
MPANTAALFDVFGTLLDVYSVTRRAEELFVGHGERLARLWREKQIEYSRLRTLSSRYASFSEVTRDALEYSLQAMKIEAAPEDIVRLLDEYKRLAPFSDVAPALARLHDAGVRLGVLSNGDSEMLETALVTSGLHRYIDLVLSADQVRAFKTSPTVYALGPRALKLQAHQIAFVSSNCWDACGAAWYGYSSFWVNRTDAPLERLGVKLNGTGASLADAADFVMREFVKQEGQQGREFSA